MKLFLNLLFIVAITATNALSQALPVVDNFTFTGNLTANGWLNYPTVGVNVNFPATATTTPGLSFTGYNQSGIGNAAQISGDGEDVYLPFNSQTTGTVYAAAMIKVNAASQATNGDYFFHFYGKNGAGTNYQFCRFFVKDVSTAGFNVSLLKTTAANGAAHSYASSAFYPYGTTIMVVLKYVYDASASANDPCTAYVFDTSFPMIEPASPTVGPVIAGATAAGDAGELLGLSIRRSDATMNVAIDGMKVSTTWAGLALPVTLSRFDVQSQGKNALLAWDIAHESESPTYTIQQSNDGVHFENIFTQNTDNQNNTINKKYQYEVKNLSKGTYYFRLLMTDKVGWKEYSQIKNVRIESDKVNIFASQNQVHIRFENENDFDENIDIEVVDIQGRVVKTLTMHQAQQIFAIDDLIEGIYFLRCEKEKSINGFKLNR